MEVSASKSAYESGVTRVVVLVNDSRIFHWCLEVIEGHSWSRGQILGNPLVQSEIH